MAKFKSIYLGILGLAFFGVGYFVLQQSYLFVLQKWAMVPRSVGQFDPVLGWRPRPSSEGTSWRTGKKILYRINADGEREFDNSRSDPNCRIVALGDSHTFGDGIKIEDHWLTQLQKNLPRVNVRNLAVSGYGVDQELLRFQIDGAKLKPRLTIAYFKHFEERHLRAVMWLAPKPYYLMNERGDLTLHTEHIRVYEKPPTIDLGYTDPSNQSMKLGVRILQELDKEVRKAGGKFLLISGVRGLCESMNIPHCLRIRKANEYPIVSTAGEYLSHLNEEGSLKLAATVAGYIKRENLLGIHCDNP